MKHTNGLNSFVQILWHGFYPWDVRLEKFINAIESSGSQVGVIGRNVNDAPTDEFIGKTKIERIGKCNNYISKVLNYPLFINPIFFKKVNILIRKNKPKLIIVRDLPLSMPAIAYGSLHKIPVVLDMAENYPAALLSYENPSYKWFLLSNAYLPRLYERIVVRNIDAIIVVAEEQKERLVAIGVCSERIYLVQNTPDYRFATGMKRKIKVNDSRLSEIDPLFLYIGKIDIHRGINYMIEGFDKILNKFTKAGMVIVGNGKEKEKLEKLTNELGLSKRIIFTGWIDHTELPGYIQLSKICCIPHLKSEHTDTTIPNKLFDYMAFGKPVLVSDLEPVKRIVNKIGCGEVYKNDCAESFANQALRMLEKMDLIDMGYRGAEAVKKEFNWENDSMRLLKIVSDFTL